MLATDTTIGPDGKDSVHVRTRLFLDPKTWLSFAATMTQDGGAVPRTRTNGVGPIRSSFVPTASLPTDFFTPAAIDAWAP